ncbi:MAG: hypothetical protein FJ315_07235 [SAR202 cluster bacterium]|nr:hypothetical protein [SAR202 cluster bacterium]
MLSPLRMRKLTRFFNVLDGNVNGYVEAFDFSRFVSVLSQIRGRQESSPERKALQGAADEVWKQVCKSADKSNDARVTLQEWLSWNDEIAKPRPTTGEHPYAQLSGRIFDALDADRNGAITAREYRDFLRAFGVGRDVDVDSVFAALDANRDGNVTSAEAVQRFAEFWSSEDQNAVGNRIFGPF